MSALEELSRKSYLLEDWYTSQTKQWDRLSNNGWVFNKPSFNPFTVGICMSKGAISAVFRVSSKLTYQEIHTKLLAFCLAFEQAAT